MSITRKIRERMRERERGKKKEEDKFLSSSSSSSYIHAYTHTVFSNAARMSFKNDLTVQQTIYTLTYIRKLCTSEKKKKIIVLQSTIQVVLFVHTTFK